MIVVSPHTHTHKITPKKKLSLLPMESIQTPTYIWLASLPFHVASFYGTCSVIDASKRTSQNSVEFDSIGGLFPPETSLLQQSFWHRICFLCLK